MIRVEVRDLAPPMTAIVLRPTPLRRIARGPDLLDERLGSLPASPLKEIASGKGRGSVSGRDCDAVLRAVQAGVNGSESEIARLIENGIENVMATATGTETVAAVTGTMVMAQTGVAASSTTGLDLHLADDLVEEGLARPLASLPEAWV